MDFTKVLSCTDYIEVYFILGDHFTSPDILAFNHFVWNKIKILLYISSVYKKNRFFFGRHLTINKHFLHNSYQIYDVLYFMY